MAAKIRRVYEYMSGLNRALAGLPPLPEPPKPEAPILIYGPTTGGPATRQPNRDADAAAARGARTAEQEAKKRQKTIDDLKHEAEQLGRTNREQFIYNELKKAGTTATTEQGQAIVQMAGALFDAKEAQEKLNKITQEYADIAKSAISGFIKDMRNGVSATEALSRALDRVTDRLIDMALNVAFAALFPGSGGGGAASGLIGALFGGGKRAGGGPVQAGHPYRVGEQGPEIFVPASAGRIVPNKDIPDVTDDKTLSALFGGGRAGGGPVQAGRAYTVGEQGPEMFVPNVAGRIRPTDELTGSKSETISLNYAPMIDARGASVDAIRELKAEMARDRQAFQSRMVASIIDAKRRSVRI